jgi:DNA invertase Pin-like site-specific DNA recombinase
MTKLGYARVSSKTQDYTAQVEALKAAGCHRIYSEKASGKSRDRREFERLLGALTPGDTVVVSKLDRLARSTRDLLNVLHELRQRECSFIALDEPWCDTSSDFGQLVMTIMAGLAEWERKLIRKRCDDGIAKAKARGTKWGRKPSLDPSQRRTIAARYSAGETMAELARDYSCGEATIWRALQP